MTKIDEKLKSYRKPMTFGFESSVVSVEKVSKGHLASINERLIPKIKQNQQEIINSSDGLSDFIVK